MAELATLMQTVQAQADALLIVFFRMSAFFALLPGFGERTVPTRVKLIIAFATTIVVTPLVEIPDGTQFTVLVIATEAIAGLAFGLGVRLFILALQTAGSIAAQATSLAQLLGGNGADPLPAMGHILIVAGLALAVMHGIHISAIQLIVSSYQLIPIGEFADAAMITPWGIHRVSRAFNFAFSLAAPFVILSVIYNLAMGAINRAMPQLMVAFVGAPLITAGGLFLLFLAAPLMLAVWVEALDRFMISPMQGGN